MRKEKVRGCDVVTGVYEDPDVYEGSTDTEQNFLDFADVENNRNVNYFHREHDAGDLSENELDRHMDTNKQFRNIRSDMNSISRSFTGSGKSIRSKKGDKVMELNSDSISKEDTKEAFSIEFEQNQKNQTVPKLALKEKESTFKSKQTNGKQNGVKQFIFEATTNKCENGEKKSEDNSKPLKLPSMQKCEHMITTSHLNKDVKLSKHSKAMKGLLEEDKCVICEITEATAQYASVEANRMLMEIVYPHEFYDKFQRSRRSKAKLADTKVNTSTKELNICRPAKFSPKLGRRDKGSTQSLGPSNESQEPPNTLRYSYRRETERSDGDDTLPKKIPKKDSSSNIKKEIHVHCKAKANAVVITDDSEGQKLVLKGLKGWWKKDDSCKNKEHKDLKQCKYSRTCNNRLCCKIYELSSFDTVLTGAYKGNNVEIHLHFIK